MNAELAVIPEEENKLITVDQLKKVMPRGTRADLSEQMLETINNLTDGEDRDIYRENVIGYASVLKDGRYCLKDYINAVKYVTRKLMGDTNIAAYVKTFPQRYQAYLDKEYEAKHIESVVAIYNKNQLIAKVYEQTLIPTHIVNADLHQKAINRLAYLMMHATSEKVQGDSAAKLVDALKMPETTKIELDIGITEDKSIEDLRQTTLDLVAQQKLMIKAGAKTVKEIAHSRLLIDRVVEGEIVE